MATQALKYTQLNNETIQMEALTPNGEILVTNFRQALITFCDTVYQAVKVMPFAAGGQKIIKDISKLAKDDKDGVLKFKPQDVNFAKGIAAGMLDKEGTIFKLKNVAPAIGNKFKNTPSIPITDEVRKSLEMFINCFDFLIEQTLYDEDEQ